MRVAVAAATDRRAQDDGGGKEGGEKDGGKDGGNDGGQDGGKDEGGNCARGCGGRVEVETVTADRWMR